MCLQMGADSTALRAASRRIGLRVCRRLQSCGSGCQLQAGSVCIGGGVCTLQSSCAVANLRMSVPTAQTAAELRERLPDPYSVSIGPQAALVLDVGNVQVEVGRYEHARSIVACRQRLCAFIAQAGACSNVGT